MISGGWANGPQSLSPAQRAGGQRNRIHAPQRGAIRFNHDDVLPAVIAALQAAGIILDRRPSPLGWAEESSAVGASRATAWRPSGA
jgi:hypothetical protein